MEKARQSFEPHFWEFNERVWNGETYTDSFCRELPGVEAGNRALCKGYRRGEQGWWFVLDGGCSVLVPDTNVRFVWGKTVAVDTPGNGEQKNKGVGEQEMVQHSETPATANLSDQNGFPVSKAQAAYAEQNNTRNLADYAESRPMPTPEGLEAVQPKRRGRPPKVRPVE